MKVKLSFLWDLLAGGLTILILAALLTPPASASLQIVGETRYAALWQRIYDRLPSAWKTARPLRVQEVAFADLNPDDEGSASENRQEASTDEETTFINGEYESEDEEAGTPATIRLLDSLEEADSGRVFAHEYGHFVWCERMTPAQQRQYTHLWKQQKRAGKLITEYSAENEAEGFAEAFSYFCQNSAVLQEKDAKSWRFLLALQTSAQKQAGDDNK